MVARQNGLTTKAERSLSAKDLLFVEALRAIRRFIEIVRLVQILTIKNETGIPRLWASNIIAARNRYLALFARICDLVCRIVFPFLSKNYSFATCSLSLP